MLKWGSKMRPPFFDDFRMEKGGGTDHEGSPPESLRLSSTRGIGGFVPVKNTPVPPLTGGGGFPCRALMIRAVPNISVPCSYDPCHAKYFRAVALPRPVPGTHREARNPL